MVKIIHYCWFGGRPLSKLAKKCLKSWRKYYPDFEIKRWDESNFDVKINNFCAKAYEQGKWAFVADVARCYALKKYGGLYFDTDMIVTKRTDFIFKSSFVAGWESEFNVAAGVIWVDNPENDIINGLWNFYENNEFDFDNVYSFSIPTLLTDILQNSYGLTYNSNEIQQLKDNVCIYSREFFYPIGSDAGANLFTDNTCMIHYYLGSWLPKDQKLRAKFRIKYGDKWGNRILNVLVAGKHACRKMCKVILYPYIKRRRKMEETEVLDKYKSDISEQFENLHNNDYIVFCNKNWLGTSIATRELFENTIKIEEINYEIIADYIVSLILKKKIKLVIFSAFSRGWSSVIRKVKDMSCDVTIKVLWHGSFALTVEEYDWDMFREIMLLYHANKIDSLGFVKKSMYEFYKAKGFRAEFVANRVEIAEKPQRIESENKKLRIGVYASGNRWVKNFYNQLVAASMFNDVVVDIIPLNDRAVILSKLFNIEITGDYASVSREQMIKRLASNDINLYVTFTECAPMMPLESLEVGVPCITANNHHYWEDSELEKYLIVNQVDNPMAIYEKVKLCLENRNKIMQLYQTWRAENNKQSINSVEAFLKV